MKSRVFRVSMVRQARGTGSGGNFCVGAALACGAFALAACGRSEAPAAPLQPPAPLRAPASPPTEAETAAPAFASPLPRQGHLAELGDGSLQLGGRRWSLAEGTPALRALLGEGDGALVLTWPRDLYLAQVAGVLAALADAHFTVWWKAPGTDGGFPLQLMDAVQFQAWLDEPKPGRLRIIQREDGLELQTSVGKMAGPDPNGPTLPQRDGHVDVAGLRRALTRLQERFGEMDGVCLVPSFGVELDQVARTLGGLYRAPGKPFFEPFILVYPRPGQTVPKKR